MAHFYMSLGSGSKGFVPARCFGDGSRGFVLFLGQVPLLLALENVGVVIVPGAGTVSLHPSLPGLVSAEAGTYLE